MIIKICGITRQCDADDAILAGANALGFILAPESPRFIAPAKIRSIIRDIPETVTTVGVFVNGDPGRIRQVVETSGIRSVQLHGEEKPEILNGLSIPVWKAFRVGSEFKCDSLADYRCEAFLLDTLVEGKRGGTGRQFDWRIAVEAKKYGRIIVSGGIGPDNVAEAIRQVMPYGIDCNSRVERSPGIKDRERMRQLCEAIEEVLCSL